MRVIAGKYRGRKLTPPKDMAVRPTIDRIKEALFNIIQFKVRDACVLDLFSGSGAIGLECVSRGAKYVVLCDKDKASIEIINKNFSGVEFCGKIVQADFLNVIATENLKYDIVYLDPPYNSDLAERAIIELVKHNRLADDATIIFEHNIQKKYSSPNGLEIYDTRKHGEVILDFIKQI